MLALKLAWNQPLSTLEWLFIALASGVARAMFEPNFDPFPAFLLAAVSTILFAASLHGLKAFTGFLVTHNSPLDAASQDQSSIRSISPGP